MVKKKIQIVGAAIHLLFTEARQCKKPPSVVFYFLPSNAGRWPTFTYYPWVMPPLGHRTWWRPRFCLPWDLSSGVSARGTVDGGTSSPKRNVFWFSITLKLLLESRVCCICIEKKRRSMKKKKMLTKIRKLLWLTKVEVCKESGFFFFHFLWFGFQSPSHSVVAYRLKPVLSSLSPARLSQNTLRLLDSSYPFPLSISSYASFFPFTFGITLYPPFTFLSYSSS